MGAQRRVTVTAALNANTNPNLSLEWFVNGVKQAQTSRTFDFTPTEVGTFAIQAKVGNLSSNTLNVTLALPVFAVESAAFATASQIKIKAPGGAAVTLTGAELADTSKYDLTTGEYVIDLKAAVVQGTTVTVRLDRAGSQILNQAVTFDTRTLALDEFQVNGVELAAGADGVYQIVRPFDAGALYAKTYSLVLEQKNVLSTTPTELKVETTVPAGAAAISSSSELVTTLANRNFVVNSTSTLGLYTHKISIGGKTVEVKVNVVEPVREIVVQPGAFEFNSTFVKDATLFNQTTGAKLKFDASYNSRPALLNAAGEYQVVKPFSSKAPVYGQAGATVLTNKFSINLLARNFTAPAFGNNQWSVEVSGPSAALNLASTTLFNGFEVEHDGATSTSGNDDLNKAQIKSFQNFAGGLSTTGGAAETSNLVEFFQYIDRGTPAGLYTIKMTAGPSGTGVVKEVKVRVVEPTPTLEFFADTYQSSQASSSVMGITTNGTYTRLQQVVRSGNTITIEKPIVAAADITLEWFTVLTNWQSALVKDTLLLSNDSLKTPAQREYFVNGDGVKDVSAMNAYATADKVLATNTLSNLVTANLNQIDGVNNEVSVTGANTDGVKDAVKYAVYSAVVEGFTSSVAEDDTSLLASAINVPADGVITIDPALSIAGTVTINTTKSYTIRVYGATGADDDVDTHNDFTFVVVAAKLPNFIELGGSNDLFPTSPTGQGYKFVNFEMSSSGPANLFPSIPAVKAAIALTAGKDGLVLAEQTSLEHAGLQTRVRTAKANTTYELDVTNPVAIVDGQTADQFGLRRAPLVVTSATVAGTYNMTFKVDTLELPITIVIKNPEPKLFVLSGTNDATPALRASTPTDANIRFSTSSTASEFIKFFDATGQLDEAADFASKEAADASDLFASSSTGVFTVDLKSNYAAAKSGFYGRLAIADLPKGAYDFKIVKSYPDGRVETIIDRAEVTGHDNNGLAVFGTPTVLNVNNTMFINNFLINELAYVKGTYVFDFTIGTINKKYTINVVDLPSFGVNSLKVGATTTSAFGGEYIIKPAVPFAGGKIVLDFKLNNLTDAQYVSVSGAALGTAIRNNFTPPAETIQAIKDLTTLDLGSLAEANRSNDDKLYFTLKFYNAVPYSTSAARYTQVGETQQIVIGFRDDFDTSTTPVMTFVSTVSVSPTASTINFKMSVNGEYYYYVKLASSTVPTRNEIIGNGGTLDANLVKKAASVALNADTNSALALTDLLANTNYILYVVSQNGTADTGNISDILAIPFKTAIVGSLTAVTIDLTGANKGVVNENSVTNLAYLELAADPSTKLLDIVSNVTTVTNVQASGFFVTGATQTLIAKSGLGTSGTYSTNKTGTFLIVFKLDGALGGSAKVISYQIISLGNYAS
jgi:hypothetical protein